MADEPSTPRRPRWKRILRAVGIYAGIPLGLFVLILVILEDSFIYFPTRPPNGNWTLEPWMEDVELATSDGVRLHGWFCRADSKAEWTILFFHGNAGNLTDRRGLVSQYRQLPADVLIIDYRGYGKSEGSPSEEGLYADARAAYDYLTTSRGVPAERIVIFGNSLGCAPAIELAVQVPCGRVVIQSAFTNVPEMSKRVIPVIPIGWALRHRYDNLAKVRSIAAPKLHIHSPDDEVIPFEMGRRVFEAAAEPKTFYEASGGHNELVYAEGSEYDRRLREFLGIR